MINDILQTVNHALNKNEKSVDKFIIEKVQEIAQVSGCLQRTDNFTLKVGVFRHQLPADVRSVENIYASGKVFEKVSYQQIARLHGQAKIDNCIRWAVRGNRLYIAPVMANPLNVEIDVTYYHPANSNPILLPDRAKSTLEQGVIASVAADYKIADQFELHNAIYNAKLEKLTADFDYNGPEDDRFESIKDAAASATDISDMAEASSFVNGQSRIETGIVKYNDL